MPKPDQTFGFVYTVKGGKRNYHAAIRFDKGIYRGTVARYKKDGGDGMFCGPKVAKTFFEHDWNGVTPGMLEDRVQKQEQLMARMAELNRLMPQVSSWNNQEFKCRMCGSLIWNQEIHLRDHTERDVHSPRFAQTLTSLFGGMF